MDACLRKKNNGGDFIPIMLSGIGGALIVFRLIHVTESSTKICHTDNREES